MSSRRLTAVFSAMGGAAMMLLTLAPATAGAGAPAVTRIGAPYEAGGVWFVPAADPNYDQRGLAAEYDGAAAGGRTFGGDRFDPHALAAGHPTLPTNTWVEVTNLDTGKVLQLRINDRGPSAPDRLLNLTPAAAHALGVGVGQSAHVRVRIIGAKPAEDRVQLQAVLPTPALKPAGFGVQIGAFSQRERAQQVADQVATIGHARVTALQRAGATLYRVTLPAHDAHAACALRDQAGGLGFPGAQVTAGL